jgi:hypothetical protein
MKTTSQGNQRQTSHGDCLLTGMSKRQATALEAFTAVRTSKGWIATEWAKLLKHVTHNR